MSSYDIESLRECCRRGQRYRYLFFWKPVPEGDGRPGPGCLGQWWPAAFTAEGVEYRCAEQYMMAEKARLFGDEAMLAAILDTGDPKRMKALGRRVQGFDQKLWEENCREIVVRGNLAKFGQDPELRAYLLGTGEQVLVEASPLDRIWGIGLGCNSPDAQDPLKWRGKNLLGFALMEVRDRLQKS